MADGTPSLDAQVNAMWGRVDVATKPYGLWTSLSDKFKDARSKIGEEYETIVMDHTVHDKIEHFAEAYLKALGYGATGTETKQEYAMDLKTMLGQNKQAFVEAAQEGDRDSMLKLARQAVLDHKRDAEFVAVLDRYESGDDAFRNAFAKKVHEQVSQTLGTDISLDKVKSKMSGVLQMLYQTREAWKPYMDNPIPNGGGVPGP